MKIGKKSYIVFTLILMLGLILGIYGSTSTSVKATENSSETEVSSSETLKTESSVTMETEESVEETTEVIEESEAFDPMAELTTPQNVSAQIVPSKTNTDGPTDAEMDAANAAYNQAHGNFNPNAKIAYVSNWTEFARAYMDQTVTKIKLTADITSENITVDGVSTTIFSDQDVELRKSSLEIDGGYVDGSGVKQKYMLKLNGRKTLGTFTTPTSYTEVASDGSTQPRAMFHIHDVSVAKDDSEASNARGFIGATEYHSISGQTNAKSPYTKNWYFRMGNIDTDRDNNASSVPGVARLMVVYQAEVTAYGVNNISTSAENFYLGGFITEPKAVYKGITEYRDYSIIWFTVNLEPTATAYDGKFTIGEDSFVYLTNIRSAAETFPAVYASYQAATIKEGATVNIDMPGNAWRFNAQNSSLRVKNGATLNLISRGTGSVFQYGRGAYMDNTFNSLNPNNVHAVFEPGSSVFMYGKTATALGTIDFNTSVTNSSLTFDNVKQYDIRNNGGTNGGRGNYRAINLYNTLSVANGRNSNYVEFINSDISLWNNGFATAASDVPMDGSASEDYVKVGGFKVTSQNANTIAAANSTPYPVSTDSALSSTLGKFNPLIFKRISGQNTAPEVIMNPTTDADKSLKVRVLLGERPTGYDSEGNTILIPVYAKAGEASVYFKDSHGTSYGPVLTDADGYAMVEASLLQKAGQNITAHAQRGPSAPNIWVGEEKTTPVIDVTPPEPAKVLENKITNATKQLIAENLEPNAVVYLSITGSTSNAGSMIPAGTVGADGKWTHNLSGYLNVGDNVIIYLEDNAGLAKSQDGELPFEPAAPTTNSHLGNLNPFPSDLAYRDTTFKKATMYTVEDILPDKPLMSKTVVSSNDTVTQVGDTLTYTLTATNGKGISGEKFTWFDVTITDVIPEELDFSAATADLMINDRPATTGEYDYNEASRLLTVKVGDLDSRVSGKVTFKATVKASAIGKVIKNTAKASGNSPREEAPFLPGIDVPGRPREVFEAEASVDNPGGPVFGSLVLTSAPDVIDFKKHALTPNDTRMNDPELSAPLTVSDSRGNRKSWTLTAKLTKVMANTEDGTKILTDAIKFNDGTTEESLALNSELTIKTHTHASAGDYVVSDDWSANGAGLKLEVPAGSVPKLGKYQAEITWILGDTPTP
ncbi:isopeptide-forming domain-containing fimbrial protein [Enterococcus sp. BWR-S5]|uniref:isopeptide-forming domain-containing fimbrial protein n=1 Tax=Enterococcus sp. BWR-S5 TaxID=2787714 RepID=UPI0019214626|nr:isopeptide-forming domain-containing fimbrial protein [Enterococcus sp. BWR-S5]MBL1227569.1 isopeptide-forming domain-containing fimbrial protein [Enterococcus sp. BWR-S5]